MLLGVKKTTLAIVWRIGYKGQMWQWTPRKGCSGSPSKVGFMGPEARRAIKHREIAGDLGRLQVEGSKRPHD